MPPTANLEALTCSFCNKSQSEVVKLVAGAGVYICNECVELCNQIITEELDRKEAQAPQSGRSPKSQDPTTIKVWDGLSDDRLLEEMVRAHAAHQKRGSCRGSPRNGAQGAGASWARIGEALGMTRQSAWERFSGRNDDTAHRAGDPCYASARRGRRLWGGFGEGETSTQRNSCGYVTYRRAVMRSRLDCGARPLIRCSQPEARGGHTPSVPSASANVIRLLTGSITVNSVPPHSGLSMSGRLFLYAFAINSAW